MLMRSIQKNSAILLHCLCLADVFLKSNNGLHNHDLSQ